MRSVAQRAHLLKIHFNNQFPFTRNVSKMECFMLPNVWCLSWMHKNKMNSSSSFFGGKNQAPGTKWNVIANSTENGICHAWIACAPAIFSHSHSNHLPIAIGYFCEFASKAAATAAAIAATLLKFYTFRRSVQVHCRHQNQLNHPTRNHRVYSLITLKYMEILSACMRAEYTLLVLQKFYLENCMPRQMPHDDDCADDAVSIYKTLLFYFCRNENTLLKMFLDNWRIAKRTETYVRMVCSFRMHSNIE